MSKRKKKAKLYARYINGKIYTGYNKDLLDDLVLSIKKNNYPIYEK